ncbi:hypothetical protein LDENG_00198890 [Lucifuga dentata]|nr:hypothetical protein LDENG_00198890 [Lucifuga dentata]
MIRVWLRALSRAQVLWSGFRCRFSPLIPLSLRISGKSPPHTAPGRRRRAPSIPGIQRGLGPDRSAAVGVCLCCLEQQQQQQPADSAHQETASRARQAAVICGNQREQTSQIQQEPVTE